MSVPFLVRLRTEWRQWKAGRGGTGESFGRRKRRRPWAEGLEGRELLAVTVTEFKLPTNLTFVNQIALGPDGNLWFTENASTANKIGRITPAGVITEFKIPTFGSAPWGIVSDPTDNALWFTEMFGGKIGRIDTSGNITEFPIDPTGKNTGQFPHGITVGPDGALWFTESLSNKIGRMTTTGAVTEFPITTGSGPENITVGADKKLHFTLKSSDQVATLDPATGTITQVKLPSIIGDPTGITLGPDGDLWITEDFLGSIATFSAISGSLAEYPIRGVNFPQPTGIANGPDGALYFGEKGAKSIGVISTVGIMGQIPVTAPAGVTANPSPAYVTAGPAGSNTVWFTDPGTDSIGVVNLGGTVTPTPTTPTTTPTTVTPTPTTTTPSPTSTTPTPTPTPPTTTPTTPTPTPTTPTPTPVPTIPNPTPGPTPKPVRTTPVTPAPAAPPRPGLPIRTTAVTVGVPPTPPHIIGVTQSLNRATGVESVTLRLDQAIVTGPLLATPAFNLINPGADGKFGTRDDVYLKVGAVQYNARLHTITMLVGPRSLIHGPTAVLVQPWGVMNAFGQSLDGKFTGVPGSHYLTVIGL